MVSTAGSGRGGNTRSAADTIGRQNDATIAFTATDVNDGDGGGSDSLKFAMSPSSSSSFGDHDYSTVLSDAGSGSARSDTFESNDDVHRMTRIRGPVVKQHKSYIDADVPPLGYGRFKKLGPNTWGIQLNYPSQ